MRRNHRTEWVGRVTVKACLCKRLRRAPLAPLGAPNRRILRQECFDGRSGTADVQFREIESAWLGREGHAAYQKVDELLRSRVDAPLPSVGLLAYNADPPTATESARVQDARPVHPSR